MYIEIFGHDACDSTFFDGVDCVQDSDGFCNLCYMADENDDCTEQNG